MKVAFDLDGCLIHQEGQGEPDTPRYEVLMVLLLLNGSGSDLYVWSGGGVDYARRWTEKLGISQHVTVVEKGSFVPDVALDDEEVTLGKLNIKV